MYSYSGKHQAESLPQERAYVTNGVFCAAASMCGLIPWERVTLRGLNVWVSADLVACSHGSAREMFRLVFEVDGEPEVDDDLMDRWQASWCDSEKQFQRVVVSYAESRGWSVAETRGSNGFPDLVLERDRQIVAAELKAERGVVTDQQEDWLRRLDDAGVATYLWRPDDWDFIQARLA